LLDVRDATLREYPGGAVVAASNHSPSIDQMEVEFLVNDAPPKLFRAGQPFSALAKRASMQQRLLEAKFRSSSAEFEGKLRMIRELRHTLRFYLPQNIY